MEVFTKYLWQIIILSFGYGLTLVTVLLLDKIIKKWIERVVARSPSLKTSYVFLRRVLLSLIIILGVSFVTFTAFPELGPAIASLFVAAGFASIVIGLAAQTTFSNVIAGIMLSLTQPIKLEDAVLFRNEFCFVEDLSLMYATLRTWDNRRLIVPNSVLQSEVIVNYSARDPTKLVPVFVDVSHEANLDLAMKIMVDVAKRHPDCLPIGDLPNAMVMEIHENGVRVRLLSRAKDQPTAFTMARDLLRDIKKEFAANGIEFAYPRRYIKFNDEAILSKDKPKGDEN
ncbi:MAG: mechanosensitive ion channel family protein [Candidatus Methanomethyliales bacterium]|nr:mechanosensitive ion channel family protein [Candidatus Methanomethylicales archaeon]